jgi:hypothetical protein
MIYANSADFAMWLFIPAGMYVGGHLEQHTKAPATIEVGASIIGCATIGAGLAALWPAVVAGSVAHVVYQQVTKPTV